MQPPAQQLSCRYGPSPRRSIYRDQSLIIAGAPGTADGDTVATTLRGIDQTAQGAPFVSLRACAPTATFTPFNAVEYTPPPGSLINKTGTLGTRVR